MGVGTFFSTFLNTCFSTWTGWQKKKKEKTLTLQRRFSRWLKHFPSPGKERVSVRLQELDNSVERIQPPVSESIRGSSSGPEHLFARSITCKSRVKIESWSESIKTYQSISQSVHNVHRAPRIPQFRVPLLTSETISYNTSFRSKTARQDTCTKRSANLFPPSRYLHPRGPLLFLPKSIRDRPIRDRSIPIPRPDSGRRPSRL